MSKWAIDIAVKLGMGRVRKEVHAPRDGDAELATRENSFRDIPVEEGGNDGTGDTAIGSANADGTELGEIRRVFMQGKEAAGSEDLDNGLGNIICDEAAKNRDKSMEERRSGLLIWIALGVESIAFECIGVVSKGASAGAWL